MILHGGRVSPFVRRVELWLAAQQRPVERRYVSVFDPVDDEGAESATMSHVSARQEYRNLVAALNLPLGQVEPMRLSA